ncbi:hypothetical protein FB446DRAFT_785199 [Lentinula raphanica]|nr:hypothetical protein FB446DRAFT_785199 [Lentinula raphanica]
MGLVSSYEPLPQDIDLESEKSLTSESKLHRLGTIERYLVIIVLALALLNLLLALTTTLKVNNLSNVVTPSFKVLTRDDLSDLSRPDPYVGLHLPSAGHDV